MWFKRERCSHPPGYEAVGLHKAEGWDCQNALAAGLWMRSLEKKSRKEVVCKNKQLKRKRNNNLKKKMQKYVR